MRAEARARKTPKDEAAQEQPLEANAEAETAPAAQAEAARSRQKRTHRHTDRRRADAFAAHSERAQESASLAVSVPLEHGLFLVESGPFASPSTSCGAWRASKQEAHKDSQARSPRLPGRHRDEQPLGGALSHALAHPPDHSPLQNDLKGFEDR